MNRAKVDTSGAWPPPDPCHIIRILEGTASRMVSEGLLVFSSEALARDHMKNMAPGESFYVISIPWRTLVERGSAQYDTIVVDWVYRADVMVVLPLE